MKSIFKKIFSILIIFALLTASFFYYYKKDFFVNLAINNEKRQNQNSVPEKKNLEITSLGHSLSYADFMWISMIQYIGNNIGSGNYKNHSIALLERITELSPKFSTAYEWILWMLPIPQNSNLSYSEEQKIEAELPVKIAKNGINELCDTKKIEFIKNFPLTNIAQIQENTEYKNFCRSGMLPYLIAFYEWQLMWNTEIAENYYKIAAMHDDAPWVSLILANIAGKPKDNPKAVAENFLIMAASGYDEEPFTCQQFAVWVLEILNRENITKNEILDIEKIERNLETFENNSLGTQTCQSLAERGTKYTYLQFFTEQEKKFGATENIDELLAKIGLDHIPHTKSQENMTLLKKDGNWEYFPK